MIVLVDNETCPRKLLTGRLVQLGHEVSEYASSEHLPPLELLWRPSMLVTRYELPGENGLVLADRFHVGYPSTPILILTAAASPLLAKRAEMRSFLSVCEEPVDYAGLTALIDSLCQGWRTNLSEVDTVHTAV